MQTGGQALSSFDPFNWLANKAVNSAGGPAKVFGTKPSIAPYTATNLGTAADTAVKANSANMDDIMSMLDKMFPGFTDDLKQGGKNTLSMLRGEIPQDVQDAVTRSSAYQSLMGGFAGSGMSKALTARDFGETSMALMSQGTNSAQQWAGISEGATAPYLVTAPAQADATFRNNLYKQATEQFQYNVDAAPDPGAAGIFNLQTALGSQAMSFGMGAAMGGMRGSAMSGSGGGGMGGGGVTGAANYSSNPYSTFGPYASGYQFPTGG